MKYLLLSTILLLLLFCGGGCIRESTTDILMKDLYNLQEGDTFIIGHFKPLMNDAYHLSICDNYKNITVYKSYHGNMNRLIHKVYVDNTTKMVVKVEEYEGREKLD